MVEMFLHFAIKIVLLLIEKAARDVLMNKINQFLLSIVICTYGGYVRILGYVKYAT